MIFNEIYGCYYNTVAKIIGLAIDGKLTEKEMMKVVSENAFDESMLTIIPALKQQKWQLIDKTYNTPIKEKPTMPMTTLEKRWLKTIMLDQRIKLFCSHLDELEGIEPLFYPDDIIYFDRYSDGDDYENPDYVKKFHVIMRAIKEHRKVRIHYRSGKEKQSDKVYMPVKMEYSDKENKFRVLARRDQGENILNMARIINCELLNESFSENIMLPQRRMRNLIFELKDERNALERCMMRFAHHKKKVERMNSDTYKVELEYDVDDETDILIQVLMFGSFIKVIEPKQIKEELKKRLLKQLQIMEI